MPYKCEVCGRCYDDLNKLHKHERTHDKSSFQCHDCEKIFSKKTNLIEHVKIHQNNEHLSEENLIDHNSENVINILNSITAEKKQDVKKGVSKRIKNKKNTKKSTRIATKQKK